MAKADVLEINSQNLRAAKKGYRGLIFQNYYSFQYVDTGSCKGESGAALFELVKGKNHQFMVAYGVVHGCLGKCCSIEYPSVFTSLGNADVLRFLNGVGITINVKHIAVKDQNTDPVVYIGLFIFVIIFALLLVVGFLYNRRKRNFRYERLPFLG